MPAVPGVAVNTGAVSLFDNSSKLVSTWTPTFTLASALAATPAAAPCRFIPSHAVILPQVFHHCL